MKEIGQLDAIDQEIIKDIADKCYEYHLKVEIGMWSKGKIVWEYRGANSLSFYELEKQTQRDHHSIKFWHKLYINNLDIKIFLV